MEKIKKTYNYVPIVSIIIQLLEPLLSHLIPNSNTVFYINLLCYILISTYSIIGICWIIGKEKETPKILYIIDPLVLFFIGLCLLTNLVIGNSSTANYLFGIMLLITSSMGAYCVIKYRRTDQVFSMFLSLIIGISLIYKA